MFLCYLLLEAISQFLTGSSVAVLLPRRRANVQLRKPLHTKGRICVNLVVLQACVILGAVTLFGVASWYLVPEDKWLRREQVLRQLKAADEPVGEESYESTSVSEPVAVSK